MTAMHFLVDGYNILFRYSRDRHNLPEKRRRLLEQLSRHAKNLHLQVTVIFDGPREEEEAKSGHFHNLGLLFTGKSETADEKILQLIKQAKEPEKLRVVTSDRDLGEKAKGLHASVESVPEFIARFVKKKRVKVQKKRELSPLPPSSPSTEESLFDYYLQAFGNEKPVPISEVGRWLEFFEKERNDEDPF